MRLTRRGLLAGAAGLVAAPKRSLAQDVLTFGSQAQQMTLSNPSAAGGGGTATSVWSAADAAANGLTLSNGGLTVTPSGLNGQYQAIRGSISKASGKVYIEFKNTVAATNWTWSLGLANSTINLIATNGLGNSNYSCGIQTETATYVSAGFTSNYTANLPDYQPPAGDVFALAVDFAAGSVWVALNNVWSNSSNPATGSLPIISFTPATVGALFPAMSFEGAGVGVWTLQPTAASQKYAPPAGFSPWG